MPDSWTRALNAYEYPVSLPDYRDAGAFPGFFTQVIIGDRPATVMFEEYFRESCANCVEPYFEVVFWKLCRMKHARNVGTKRVISHVQEHGVSASDLHSAIEGFLAGPTTESLSGIRALLGIKTDVLAVALTFPAFADPAAFPMIDRRTAQWVNLHHHAHSDGRVQSLDPFKLGHSTLRDNDFESYLHWVGWCRETAFFLVHRTDMKWRARDVEMAVFTAARQGLPLNPLP